ncbi:hypothetical protein [Desulfofustis limnaeus]|uniref:Phage tail tape measure protein n=1 Tax=Desulfofustis limnaeus TaxID=2740163 RepID=A0ABN6M7L7_9BACT|nr:hypothetical protein [Desulfofustis limnaeus]BDD88868.1 hypothetical protein DPPLL_32330 [Desulfofustis limnaeus]
MDARKHLELFLTLNAEAFKKGLGDAGASVSTMSGRAGAALGGMRDRLRENLTAARDYNTELGRQGGLMQSLTGKVTALVGAYLGLQTLAGVTRILRDAETAGFALEASLRAANREFADIGSMNQWSATLERLSGQLRIYSKGELAAATARTVDMTKRLGLSAAQMEQVIALSGDLAAGKTDLEGAIERVTAALRGEAESAEFLGLTLNETYVKAWYEAHNASGTAWKDLDDLQKAQVRYNVFLEQSLPVQGKAADSVKTMAGAWALAKKEINDALTENESAAAAMQQLAALIAEHADEIGELATMLLTAAAQTMEFVLAHKEAIAVVGALALGLGTVSAAITSVTTVWGALNTVMLAMTGSKIVPFLGSVVSALKGAELASLSLKTVLGSLSALLLAFEIGRQIGSWLNKFAIVQKAGVGLAYTLDRTGLAAQKMWAMLTGGDVKAIERKIEIAKDAYKKSIADIEREAEKGAAKAKQKEEQSKAGSETATAKPGQPSPYLTDEEAKKVQAEAEDAWRKSKGLPTQEEEKAANDPEAKAKAEAEEARKKAEEAAKKEQEEARKKQEADRKKAAAREQAATDEAELERRMKAAEEEKFRLAEEKRREEEERREKEALEDEAKAQARAARKRTTGSGSLPAPAAPAERAATEKPQIEAIKEVAEQSEQVYRNSQQTMLADSTAEARAEAETDALDQAKTGWQTYADNVKQIQDDIAGREKSLADELNQLGGRHRTEEQGWRAKAKAAKEYQQAAEEAMKAGNLEEAQALADQAREAYGSLKGGAGKIGAAQGDRAAYAGVKSAGELGLAISKALQQTAAKNALQALPADAGLGDLGATVRGRLAAIAGGSGGTGDGTAGAGGSARVHELRFAGGSLRGGEQDIDALLRVLEKEGMRTA